MKGYRMYKAEKLCSTLQIEQLFSRASGAGAALAYPLRAVWKERDGGARALPPSVNKFIIVVPKRRLKRAVDRVLMRRRIREAYRLNRDLITAASALNIAFLYVGDECRPYRHVERAMVRLLRKIAQTLTPAADVADS